jgi:leucyl-tRNA synthetase
MNTAIAAMMEFLNARKSTLSRVDAETLTLLLAPFAPHLAEELWQVVLGREGSVHVQPWPAYDDELATEETVTVAVQVNGKLRGTVETARGTSETATVKRAKTETNVARALEGKTVKKTIFVPDKIINFIVE